MGSRLPGKSVGNHGYPPERATDAFLHPLGRQKPHGGERTVCSAEKSWRGYPLKGGVDANAVHLGTELASFFERGGRHDNELQGNRCQTGGDQFLEPQMISFTEIF